MHWSQRYLGLPFAADKDCWHYFCRIQAEQFGRRLLPVLAIDHDRLTLSAARAMSGDITAGFGWVPTSRPVEGDAVFLSQRVRPHHIGTVALVDGKTCAVHALDSLGVVVSDVLSLKANGWRIAGYWTWT